MPPPKKKKSKPDIAKMLPIFQGHQNTRATPFLPATVRRLVVSLQESNALYRALAD
jgi:hypothetical protein